VAAQAEALSRVMLARMWYFNWGRRQYIKVPTYPQDAEMIAIPPTTEPATLTGAAERMRRHRQRRRDGLRCLIIELRETEIDALIRNGLL
jgi:hypothetical protein